MFPKSKYWGYFGTKSVTLEPKKGLYEAKKGELRKKKVIFEGEKDGINAEIVDKIATK